MRNASGKGFPVKPEKWVLLPLLAFSLIFSQAPSVPAPASPAAESSPAGTFSYKPLDQLVGQRFIFRSMKTAKQRQTGYLGFDYDYNPDYREYLGRAVKIIGIEGSKYFPRIRIAVEDNLKEFVIITQSGSMDAFIYVPDVDAARAQWLNATLWYKSSDLPCCYQETTDSVGSITLRKFSPLKVVDVGASWDVARPVRFTVQTPDGRQGFVDVNVSGINVPRAVRGQNRVEDLFFNQDPRTVYSWPENVWSAIDSGNVIVGMTPEQARMSWGAPKSTGSDGPDREQWTYASGSTLHFENGQLASIEEAPKPDDNAPPDGYPKPDP